MSEHTLPEGRAAAHHSTANHVRAALSAGAAGVTCGSAIVQCAATGGNVAALVASLKQGTTLRDSD